MHQEEPVHTWKLMMEGKLGLYPGGGLRQGIPMRAGKAGLVL